MLQNQQKINQKMRNLKKIECIIRFWLCGD